MELKNRIALITGAGSGIGRAIAISLSKRGCHLLLTDVNEEGLNETRKMCAPDVRVGTSLLDVSDATAIEEFALTISRDFSKLDLLINNAGVAVGGTFEQVAEREFEWLFDINFFGVVRMCRAFLPLLKKSDDARVVNLSSVLGLVALPGQAAYVASKFAIRGFSQSLAFELEGTPVGVSIVHPGGVVTSIAKNAKAPASLSKDQFERDRANFQKVLKLPAELAGEIIVKGIERRERRILVGKDAKLISFIERLLPVSYWTVLKKQLKSKTGIKRV